MNAEISEKRQWEDRINYRHDREKYEARIQSLEFKLRKAETELSGAPAGSSTDKTKPPLPAGPPPQRLVEQAAAAKSKADPPVPPSKPMPMQP